MEWGLSIALIVLLNLVDRGRCKPLIVYARGYNKRKLPDGGWTRWFNVDHPSMMGDFESLDTIVRQFGHGCKGVPCKRPLAIKVYSIYNLQPYQEDNDIQINPRTGVKCYNHLQSNKKCSDYKVRFYCPGMGKKCRRNQMHRHHNHGHHDHFETTSVNSVSSTSQEVLSTTQSMLSTSPEVFTYGVVVKHKVDKLPKKENAIHVPSKWTKHRLNSAVNGNHKWREKEHKFWTN